MIWYEKKNDENFNIKLIEEGWSPYFCKYGYSRQYHREMLQGEVLAQSKNLLIWNPENKLANTPGRNYRLLSNWWCLRASIVEDYRRYGQIHGILSVRDDFPAILEAASKEAYITIFADLQDGIKTWLSSGAIIYDGIRNRQLKLWIPDANSADQKPLIHKALQDSDVDLQFFDSTAFSSEGAEVSCFDQEECDSNPWNAEEIDQEYPSDLEFHRGREGLVSPFM